MSNNNLSPEKPQITLGYMALTDCLPLLVAQENGYYAEQGLEVELKQEVSWANIRDKVIVGHLDAAQMLAPMVMTTSLGMSCIQKPMLTGFALGLNGNAFTVSLPLSQALETSDGQGNGEALAAVVRDRKAMGLPPLVFASVFPYSCHTLQLRYWLHSHGIDPDADVQLVVLPPSQMVDHLSLGHIDGFIAGAPWNSVAISRGIGHCLVTGYGIWQNAPEKVLGVTSEWAEENPNTHILLIRALHKAGLWLEDNRDAAANILSSYINIDRNALLPALTGQFVFGKSGKAVAVPDMLVFNRYLANYPWPAHAEFILAQLERWQQLPLGVDRGALVANCYRGDIYAAALGDGALPTAERARIGEQRENWLLSTGDGEVAMGADALCDGAIFTTSGD